MGERKLASIQIISDIRPIKDADKIEIAVVNGWNIVVQKDLHKVGDKIIYCEIDSFLPMKPEFEFLRQYSYKKMGDEEGYRIRTVKLRGVVSQGLILPLLQNLDLRKIGGDCIFEVGDDLTKDLDIKLYEPPIPAELAGKVKGNFPSFIPKTDEERVQNLVSELERYSEHSFYVTEKLDGTSVTYYLKDDVFGVCSRNLELLETEGNTYWKVARKNDIENKLRKYGKNIAIQGEIIGEGVQKNPYKIKGQEVYFFTVFDIDTQKRFRFLEFRSLLLELDLNKVHVVHNSVSGEDISLENIIKMADGNSSFCEGVPREGLVFRTMVGECISFKAISNKWLLKNE